MSWSATNRYTVDAAPAGLAFVQELLNTAGAGKPRRDDLLADRRSAQDWLAGALSAWSGSAGADPLAVDLTPEDLDRLRDLRDDLRDLVTATHDPAPDEAHGETAEGRTSPRTMPAAAHVSAQWDESGRVRLLPRGSGWRLVASIVAVEAFQAQREGTWNRLKTCRNPRCAVAFYDHSRNNSGVWHNVKVCGNAANLRAYRARRRNAATPA